MAVVQQGKPSALYSEECDGAWCMALDGVEAESMPAEMYSGAPGGKLDQKYACMADFTLRPYIRRAKLPHISSTGNAVSSGANGYSASCFLLSAIETGISQTYKDGAALAFFTGAGAAQRRICRVDGEPADWFTRTMYYSSGWRKHFVKANGALGNYTSSAAVSHIVRPCFILGPETPLGEGRGEDGSWRPAAQRGTVSLKELSVFDKIKDPDSRYLGEPVVWQVAGINHEGHPAGSVTILSQRLLCAKPFDGAEPGMPNGNPRYGYANIRQWLCSAAGPGQWYMPRHVSDSPPADANVYAPYGNPYDGGGGLYARAVPLLPVGPAACGGNCRPGYRSKSDGAAAGQALPALPHRAGAGEPAGRGRGAPCHLPERLEPGAVLHAGGPGRERFLLKARGQRNTLAVLAAGQRVCQRRLPGQCCVLYK